MVDNNTRFWGIITIKSSYHNIKSISKKFKRLKKNDLITSWSIKVSLIVATCLSGGTTALLLFFVGDYKNLKVNAWEICFHSYVPERIYVLHVDIVWEYDACKPETAKIVTSEQCYFYSVRFWNNTHVEATVINVSLKT